MINRLLTALLAFAINMNSYAGEFTISGTYEGKDVFVQNPFDKITKTFCTTGVFVNDIRVFDNPTISAFKIDLSHFSSGEKITIRIEYKDGCMPTIVNPNALKLSHDFQFMSTQVDHNSVSWSVMGEKGGKYYIKHKSKDLDWEVIDTVLVKESNGISNYSRNPNHKIGENAYQIIYINTSANEVQSKEVLFTASENYITFYPQVASTSLILSDTCDYEIEDYFGKRIKKGTGIEIPLTSMKPGKYYLIIQNRREQFIKR